MENREQRFISYLDIAKVNGKGSEYSCEGRYEGVEEILHWRLGKNPSRDKVQLNRKFSLDGNDLDAVIEIGAESRYRDGLRVVRYGISKGDDEKEPLVEVLYQDDLYGPIAYLWGLGTVTHMASDTSLSITPTYGNGMSTRPFENELGTPIPRPISNRVWTFNNVGELVTLTIEDDIQFGANHEGWEDTVPTVMQISFPNHGLPVNNAVRDFKQSLQAIYEPRRADIERQKSLAFKLRDTIAKTGYGMTIKRQPIVD